MITTIETTKAPLPVGHYSQAVSSNGLLFISGQLPIHPTKGKLSNGSIEEQATQALENLLAIAETGGSSLERILKVTVFITDISLWDKVNKVYSSFFGEHKPARAIVPIGKLFDNMLVEIEAICQTTNVDR